TNSPTSSESGASPSCAATSTPTSWCSSTIFRGPRRARSNGFGCANRPDPRLPSTLSERVQIEPFSAPRTRISRRPDGCVIYASVESVTRWPRSLGTAFRESVAAHPERSLALERGEDGSWCGCTYGEARSAADRLAQALIDRGLGPDRPLMILSGNS